MLSLLLPFALTGCLAVFATLTFTTHDGPYFIKLAGPAATIAKWDVGFEAFLQSLRYAPMPVSNSPESRGDGVVGSFHAGAAPCA
jgi:hypothetical protein